MPHAELVVIYGIALVLMIMLLFPDTVKLLALAAVAWPIMLVITLLHWVLSPVRWWRNRGVR